MGVMSFITVQHTCLGSEKSLLLFNSYFIQQGPSKFIKSDGRDIHNITIDFCLLINAKRTTTIFNIDNIS